MKNTFKIIILSIFFTFTSYSFSFSEFWEFDPPKKIEPFLGEYDSSKCYTKKEFINIIDAGLDVSNANVSCITDFSHLFFRHYEDFNQDISKWDVSNGIRFEAMFYDATSFNQDISGWDVSNGIDFGSMFSMAESFNQDIGNWDVSNGTDFREMFSLAISFNQDIGSWDVSNGNLFFRMFKGAREFNQDIGNWDVSKGTDFTNIFSNIFLNANSFNFDIVKISNEVLKKITFFEVTILLMGVFYFILGILCFRKLYLIKNRTKTKEFRDIHSERILFFSILIFSLFCLVSFVLMIIFGSSIHFHFKDSLFIFSIFLGIFLSIIPICKIRKLSKKNPIGLLRIKAIIYLVIGLLLIFLIGDLVVLYSIESFRH